MVLLRHSAAYVLARALPGVLSFVAIAVYTRLLSPDEYGRYALVVAGVGLLNVVFFQWLRLALLRFVPMYRNQLEPLLGSVIRGFAILCLLTGGIGLIPILLWRDPVWRGLMLFGLPLLWTQAWFELNLDLARSQLSPMRYGLLSWTKGIGALALGVLLVAGGWGGYGPLVGLFAGMLVAGVGMSWRPWRDTWGVPRDPELTRSLLGYGVPLTATFALAFVVSSSDRLLLAWVLGEGDTGLYAASYDIAQQSLGTLMVTVALAANPLVMRALESSGVEACRKCLRESAALLCGISFPATAGMVVLAPNIAAVLMGSSFRDAGSAVIAWVSLATLLAGLRAYYLDMAFHLARRTAQQVWIMAAAAATNLILNVCWIPVYGVHGAAYATVVAYGLAFGLSAWLGRREFPMPLLSGHEIGIVAATAMMVVALVSVRSYFGWAALAGQVLTGISVYGMAVLLLNVANCRQAFRKHLMRSVPHLASRH